MNISPSSFSFLVSRLARTVKSRLGIIDSTRFTSLLEHVRETWWWKSIGNIISYSRKIFLHPRLFFHFSRVTWYLNKKYKRIIYTRFLNAFQTIVTISFIVSYNSSNCDVAILSACINAFATLQLSRLSRNGRIMA